MSSCSSAATVGTSSCSSVFYSEVSIVAEAFFRMSRSSSLPIAVSPKRSANDHGVDSVHSVHSPTYFHCSLSFVSSAARSCSTRAFFTRHCAKRYFHCSLTDPEEFLI
jgi:hypothetical protein